jgi:quercetin dioxygenase-like cupin family protein
LPVFIAAQPKENVMTADMITEPTVTRRRFNCVSLLSLIMTIAATLPGAAAAQPAPGASAPTRREVIKQRLPGEPERDITLGTGSPPHMHTNGVMAFVVSGTVVSKVGDGPEQTFHAGGAWWEPEGAIHRVSRNASFTEGATLLAIYIAPKNATAADLINPM